MPKSKRDRIVPLTKVKKKTKAWKQSLMASVQSLVDEYPSIYVLRYQNMRNDKFKELRDEMRDSSKFYFGSSKVIRKALGSTQAEEYQQGLAQVTDVLKSTVGLLFTRLGREEVQEIFGRWEHIDYARAGSRASADFSLPSGPLENDDGPLSHTLEPLLRKHNLPVKLNRGIVELLTDHKVCTKGQYLTPDQAAILKIFQVPMSKFEFTPIAHWEKSDGSFELLISEEEAGSGDEDMLDTVDEFGGVPVPGIPVGVQLR